MKYKFITNTFIKYKNQKHYLVDGAFYVGMILSIGCIVGWYLKEGVISEEEGRDAKTYFGEKIRGKQEAML